MSATSFGTSATGVTRFSLDLSMDRPRFVMRSCANAERLLRDAVNSESLLGGLFALSFSASRSFLPSEIFAFHLPNRPFFSGSVSLAASDDSCGVIVESWPVLVISVPRLCVCCDSPVKLLRGLLELPTELLLPRAPVFCPIGGGGIKGESFFFAADENRHLWRFFSSVALVVWSSKASKSEASAIDDLECTEGSGEVVARKASLEPRTSVPTAATGIWLLCVSTIGVGSVFDRTGLGVASVSGRPEVANSGDMRGVWKFCGVSASKELT